MKAGPRGRLTFRISATLGFHGIMRIHVGYLEITENGSTNAEFITASRRKRGVRV